MKDSELVRVLDFILNRCTIREIDAVEAAVKRRRSDLSAATGLSSLDPGRLAAEMNSTIQRSLESSMSGMRSAIREYAAGVIRSEAPELTDNQLDELLDAWVPEMVPQSAGRRGAAEHRFAAEPQPAGGGTPQSAGTVSGAQRDAVLMMAVQFTDGCLGTLSAAAETALIKEFGGEWAALFWKQFPSDVRRLIKKRSKNEIDDASFRAALERIV